MWQMAGGRPTKLTPELLDEAEALMRDFMCLTPVAHMLGIMPRTIHYWYKRGERENGLFGEFFHRMKKAQSETERALLHEIRRGVDNWQSRAWLLERALPDRWGKRERLDVIVRREAERLASEYGLDAEELIAEAEGIVTGR